MTDQRQRCGWPGADPLYLDYHDREWGVPIRDEQRLFELLCLEGAQAGLAWITGKTQFEPKPNVKEATPDVVTFAAAR